MWSVLNDNNTSYGVGILISYRLVIILYFITLLNMKLMLLLKLRAQDKSLMNIQKLKLFTMIKGRPEPDLMAWCS